MYKRQALAVHSNRLALLDLGIGVEQGSPASLLARTERWRAVSDRVPLVRPPRDSRAADLLTQLRRTREDLRGAPAEAQVDLRSAATDLERRIRALDWARSDSGTPDWRPARPVSYPAALAAVRAADATLVSYVPHGPDLYACLLYTSHRLYRPPRLRGCLGSPGYAGRLDRPHPRALSRQTARPTGCRPHLEHPMTPEDRSSVADGPLDGTDTRVLGAVRELFSRTDPMPSGLTDRIKFELTLAAPVSYTHLDVYKRQGGAATSEVRWGGILLGINGPAGGGYPPAPQNPLDPVIESDTCLLYTSRCV